MTEYDDKLINLTNDFIEAQNKVEEKQRAGTLTPKELENCINLALDLTGALSVVAFGAVCNFTDKEGWDCELKKLRGCFDETIKKSECAAKMVISARKSND